MHATLNSDTSTRQPVVPDRTLMERAVAGDRDAFGTLFERHRDGLWRMCYYLLHSAPAADDAVQEAFLRALAKIATFRFESEPRAWLTSIALNGCRYTLRSEASHERTVDAADLEAGVPRGATRRGVFTSVVRREHSRRLAVALGHLTELQREVFVLHYIQDLPYDDIARLMGTNAGACRALAHRAKDVLRDNL